MSESIEGRTSEAAQGSGSPVSAGSLLRQARVAAGLHVAALAVALKVPVRRLEALEADRYELLPDLVFVRGLASSVCRALKMDAAPVLALLPVSVPHRLGSVSPRSQDSYTSSNEGRSRPAWRALPKPVAGAVAALLVATLGLVAWPLIPSSWLSNDTSAAAVSTGMVATDVPLSGAASAEGTVPGMPPPEVATSATALPASLQTAPAEPQTIPAPLAVAPVAAAPAPLVAAPAAGPVAPVANLVKPSATTPANLSTAAQAQSVTGLPTPPPGLVVFRPSASSWVEVTDAKGTVLLRRMLAAGEVAGASGVTPISVVVGRANVTQVQVRGQAFDLSSIARENVARFEVK